MVEINLLEGVAEDDTVILLRRIVKLLEASGNVDIANRQRVTLDSITAGISLSTVTNVGALGTLAGYDQRQWADGARVAYNTGIRQQLNFS